MEMNEYNQANCMTRVIIANNIAIGLVSHLDGVLDPRSKAPTSKSQLENLSPNPNSKSFICSANKLFRDSKEKENREKQPNLDNISVYYMHFNSKSSKKTNRIIATVLALLNTVECAKFCTSSNSICVVSTKDAATQQTCFTIHSASNGWASIGVGSSSMSGSDMYIAWKNKSGVAAVYNFQGVGHSIKEGTQGNVIPQPTLLGRISWDFLHV